MARMWRVAMAGVCVAWLAGCSKLTYERWSTLTTQSLKADVEETLGPPNVVKHDDEWMYQDTDRQITVRVEFAPDGTVAYSEWLDPVYGHHEMGQPVGGEAIRQEETRIHLRQP